VSEELLFQMGAPELVVQKGELKALDGQFYMEKKEKKKVEI